MRKPGRTEKPASALLEEATHLLRAAPARLYLGLFSGTVPFVLGFLYFWTDMSKGAQAGKSASAAAFVMTLLFIWMKTTQAFFSSRLREHLLGLEPSGWPLGQWLRTAMLQAAWQPTGFIVLPLALIIALPFGWVYAFYRNLLVFGTGSERGFRQSLGKAWHQALLSPLQNHALLSIVSVFSLFVFINIMQALLLMPFILKTVLGIESVFTRAGFSALNTTLLAVSWGMSYLVMEPLVNAVYTLRCFYGESIRTGEDLGCEMSVYEKRIKRVPVSRMAGMAAVLLASAIFLNAQAAYGDDLEKGADQSYARAPVSSDEIDRALDNVLERRQFQWRMPRVEEPVPEDGEPGLLEEFFKTMGETIENWGRKIADALDRFFEWLADKIPDLNPPARARGSGGLGISPDMLVLILIMVIGALGGVIAYRTIRQRRAEEPEAGTAAPGGMPDIEDEGTMADELRSSEWIRMAAELMDRGEERLALRALYLACIAQLADSGLLSIAAFKSNRDYRTELAARAHALPGMRELFDENVRTFERVWYGSHNASRDMITQFGQNNRRMLEIAEPAG